MAGDRSDERPEGIEERLRSSLRAYADLVDVPADQLPTSVPAVPRRAAVRRWRGAVLAAAAAAAVVTGSVWLATGDRSGPVDATATGAERADSAAEPSESGSAAAAGAADDLALPSAPELGVAYVVDLYTHCGVYGIDVDGVWFAADSPLVEEGVRPPSGWGDPYQRGTVTLTSADAAVFADDAGHVVPLRAAEESARPAPCD
jgi:hypothetical protein